MGFGEELLVTDHSIGWNLARTQHPGQWLGRVGTCLKADYMPVDHG